MDEKVYEGWVSVFEAGTDYEADLVRDRLDDAGLKAVVLTHRDHNFNVNVGDLARVYVMVQPSEATEARDILASAPISDEELERAAMAADPLTPSAHDADEQAMLDSGIDRIRLSGPDAERPDAADS